MVSKLFENLFFITLTGGYEASEFPCTLCITMNESEAVILNAVKNSSDEILRYAQDDNCVEQKL